MSLQKTSLDEFFELFLSDKSGVAKRSPSLDKPSLNLIRERAKLRTVEDRLRAKRSELQTQKVLLNNEWKDIEVEAEELRHDLVTFNNFVIVNTQKKERTEEQLAHNVKLIEETDNKIKDLREKIAYLKETKKKLDEEIKGHVIYENYLHEYFERYCKIEGLKNLNDIISRYEKCVQLIIYSRIRRLNIVETTREIEKKFDKLYRVAQDKIYAFQGLFYKLSEKYELVCQRTKTLERELYDIKQKIYTKFLDLETTKEAIRNLYTLIFKEPRLKLGKKRISKDNLLGQLIFIKQNIRLYQSINKKIKRMPPKCIKRKIKRKI